MFLYDDFFVNLHLKEVNKMNLREQTSPLRCWDIYAMHLLEASNQFTKQLDLDTLNTYKKKYGWLFDFEDLICNTEFDALVLTDTKRHIEWVNKGFTKMTGYAANYSKGKKPCFLQGPYSSKQAIYRISENLKSDVFFKETIINYRKNGSIYHCNIEIFPLKNAQNTISHFLALEKEIRL